MGFLNLFNREGKIIHERQIDDRRVVIRRVGKSKNFIGYRLEDKKVDIYKGAVSVGFRATNDENAKRLFMRQYKKYKRALGR